MSSSSTKKNADRGVSRTSIITENPEIQFRNRDAMVEESLNRLKKGGYEGEAYIGNDEEGNRAVVIPGDLNVPGFEDEELPTPLRVLGDLNIPKSNVRNLDGVSFDRSLYASDSELQDLSLSGTDTILGDLIIPNTEVEDLGDLEMIYGNADLQDTRIESAELRYVEKTLNISRSSVKELSDLVIGENLYGARSELQKLNDVFVEGDVNLTSSKLTEVDGLKSKSNIALSCTPLEEFEGIVPGDLYLYNTDVSELDVYVGGDIDVRKTSLEVIDPMRIRGKIKKDKDQVIILSQEV